MMRVGLGYDTHRLVEGRRLVLGGVELDHPKGLEGHSDADALCHAVGDALLGAAALGDLGTHFPDTDPQWKDSNSLDLLRHIAGLLRHYRIENIDTMLILESPHIRPHVETMRNNMAAALGIDPPRISVKATRNEGMGFLGRGEGIAAQAIVLISALNAGAAG